MDPRGVPYYTLDPATGELVAMYEDGSVQPVTGGGSLASIGAPGGARPAPQPAPGPFAAGTPRLPGGDPPAGGGPGTGVGAPRYAGSWADPIPPPGSYGVSGGTSGGGGGAGMDVRARLAAARARLSGAIGGGSGGYGGGGSGYGGGGGIPRPDRPDRLRGPWARGLDPAQAAGLTLQPTAMLPRVFPRLTPADPLYGNLAALPVGQWATILGRGTPQSIANTTGRLYQRAAGGAVPSTGRLLSQLRQGKGVEDMFQGVKAGKGDYESFLQPGYVSGQEPMPMGEAAYTYGGLLDAALSQEPALTASKYGVASGGWGSYLVDRWASKAMKKPPGKGKPIYRSVGSKLFR